MESLRSLSLRASTSVHSTREVSGSALRREDLKDLWQTVHGRKSEVENILYTYILTIDFVTMCVFGPVRSDQTHVWKNDSLY